MQMTVGRKMRKVVKKWANGTSWPKRLEYLEVGGLRGWSGQRINFPFPMVAIVGENGSGKSTLPQAAASVYRSELPKDTWYDEVQRFSGVMGRTYDSARIALTDIDSTREVPVIARGGAAFSGFHQGRHHRAARDHCRLLA